MTNYSNELSFDTVIPSAILLNENIELKAVKLYAFIKSLTKMCGYCFASNNYLAGLMKADVSSIKRWLKMLRDEGYIEIDTDKTHIHWQRKIYISDKFKKCLRRLMDKLPPVHPCAPPSLPISHILEDKNKEDKIKREEASPFPAPIFYQIHKRVKMLMTLYNKLCEEFGVTKIMEMMDRLDEYADINPKRFKQYACHAAVIRKWIRDDMSKSSKNSKVSQDWIAKIKKILNNNSNVYFSQEGITFAHGASQTFIKFNDPSCKEQVINRMRKMNLPVDDI